MKKHIKFSIAAYYLTENPMDLTKIHRDASANLVDLVS